jgi:hypothetical protein
MGTGGAAPQFACKLVYNDVDAARPKPIIKYIGLNDDDFLAAF